MMSERRKTIGEILHICFRRIVPPEYIEVAADTMEINAAFLDAKARMDELESLMKQDVGTQAIVIFKKRFQEIQAEAARLEVQAFALQQDLMGKKPN